MLKGPPNWYDADAPARARLCHPAQVKPTPEVVGKVAPALMTATDAELHQVQVYVWQLLSYRRAIRARSIR